MDSIEFALEACDYRNFGQQTAVIPVVNGSPLDEVVRKLFGNMVGQHAGMQTGIRAEEITNFGPGYFMGLSKHRLWRKKSTIGVLACECGLAECWTLETPLVVSSDTVAWPSFFQPSRPRLDYSDLGSFHFEHDQYAEAVTNLEQRL